MNIKINGETMDYQLDGESCLGDVVEGIRTFLTQQNHVYKTATYQGEPVTQESLSLSLPLQGDLDIHAVTTLDEEFSHLQLTADFFLLLRQAVMEANSEVLLQLGEEYPALSTALESILGLSFHKGFALFIRETAQRFLQYSHDKDLGSFQGYDQLIQTFLLEMDTMAKGLETPKDLWQKLQETGRHLAERLPEIPVMLSTGKDKTALSLILELINHLETSTYFLEMTRRYRMDCFPALSKAVEIHSTMNPFMKDISEALDRKDYILVGDLLEYEVAPLLQDLASIGLPDAL